MLLLIKRNLLIFFSKIWYLILAMLCICIFFFTQYNSLKYFDNNFIYIISGVDNTVGTFLLISLTLVINSIYLLYTYYLYSYDIFKCKEAIFLRISYKKWITANIISNCIIDFIIFSPVAATARSAGRYQTAGCFRCSRVPYLDAVRQSPAASTAPASAVWR